MKKSVVVCFLVCLLSAKEERSQTSIQLTKTANLFHPPSSDKDSWQRLNLLQSTVFWRVVKEGQLDFDSCLLYCSRSLGLSRVSLLAEGIRDPDLLQQSQWIDQRDPGKGLHLLSQARGKKHLELLVLLGAYYAFQPQHYYNKDSVEYFLDQAISESNELKDTSLKRQAICLLGKMFFEVNDMKRADSLFHSLTNDCESAGDKKTQARAYEYWGLYPAIFPATVRDRINYLSKAAEIYHQLNNSEGEINALTDIGYLLVLTGQLQQARDIFLKTLHLTESTGYPYVHYNTDALTMVTGFEGKFGEPFKYALQTIKAGEGSRDSIGWSYFYSRLSQMYYLEGRTNEGDGMAKKAIVRFIIDQNPAVYNIVNELTSSMQQKGRQKEALELVLNISKKVAAPFSFTDEFFYNLALSDCYISLHMIDSAELHIVKMDSMEARAEQFRGARNRKLINDEYAFLYFLKGQYRKSRGYLEKHFAIPSPTSSLANDLNVYRWLIKTDSALGDPVAGLVDYKNYTRLQDSNFSVQNVRQSEELQVLYQTQDKENQIELLSQQEKLEQAKFKQATLVRNLTITGTVAVLIIALLLYRQSSLRKKNNGVITYKNEQLQHLLTEKVWLLKEIHHRIKNNLQIIMSLLNSQSAYIDNSAALTAIHDSQHRVHAMSLIHQKLYNSENLSSIDMPMYARELVSYLGDCFGAGQRIHFDLNIEPLKIDVGQAVPLGLILNEAITNSLKYAFPNGRRGTISVCLSSTSSDHCLLSISDNGIGIPDNYDAGKTTSLGMSLMKGLSEDLDGTFSIERNEGTIIRISFLNDLAVENYNLKLSHDSYLK